MTPGQTLLRTFWFDRWKDLSNDTLKEARWRESLRDGVIAGTASPAIAVQAATTAEAVIAQLPADRAPTRDAIEINFRPDPSIADGEFANLGWLQELPKPLSKICVGQRGHQRDRALRRGNTSLACRKRSRQRGWQAGHAAVGRQDAACAGASSAGAGGLHGDACTWVLAVRKGAVLPRAWACRCVSSMRASMGAWCW